MTRWEKSGKERKKVGSIPLLPSRAPSNHPCGLCLIYQSFHTKMKKKRKDKLSLKDKGLTNIYKVLISTQSLATNPLLLCLLCIKKSNLFQLQCLYLWNCNKESFLEEEEKTYITLYLGFFHTYFLN